MHIFTKKANGVRVLFVCTGCYMCELQVKPGAKQAAGDKKEAAVAESKKKRFCQDTRREASTCIMVLMRMAL